jgi:hypothetical protein
LCFTRRQKKNHSRCFKVMAQMFRSAFKSLFRPFENRKCFHSNYYYLDDPNQPQSLPNVDLEAPINVGGELHHPIHVEDFSKHVSQLHADGDIGFSKEYELIQNESIVDEHSSENSQHADNKAKNRYLNIIACKLFSFSLAFISTALLFIACLHSSTCKNVRWRLVEPPRTNFFSPSHYALFHFGVFYAKKSSWNETSRTAV